MLKKLIATAVILGMLFVAPMAVQSEIRNMGGDNIVISGSIVEESFLEFLEATAYNSNRDYRIIIHTNGGSAYATMAIINRMRELKKRGCTFTTEVYGKAFSAGSFIFLYGDKRIMREDATLMFHTMMQQATEVQTKAGRVHYPSSITMIERMDKHVSERFLEVTGLDADSQSARYWLHGEMPDGSTVSEGSQFMSGRTALAMGIATEYIEN